MDLDRQTRRQFCSRTCSTAALAALGGVLVSVLEGCGGGSPTSASGGGSVASLPTVAGTASGSTIQVTIDAGSPLAAVGSVALVRSAAGNVLVAHTAQDAFTALSASCTHQGCGITGYADQVFVCPCHGARFDASGRVLSGPAPTALRQYQAQLAGNVLTISA
jgi:nitrite reductase/ring-hydroxylating ferredoxin subunit